MTKKISKIPSRIENAQVDELGNPMEVTGAKDILDDEKGKRQNVINKETDSALENRYTKEETYNKTELNSLITTPEVNYVNVDATDQTTSISDVLPATGTANTIYKIGNWDGTQYNTSKYTEYAWNGSAYIPLATRDHGVDDEPTTGSENLVKSGDVFDQFVITKPLVWETGAINASTGIEYEQEDRRRTKDFISLQKDTVLHFGIYANPFLEFLLLFWDSRKNYLGYTDGWLTVEGNDFNINQYQQQYPTAAYFRIVTAYDSSVPCTFDYDKITVSYDGTGYGSEISNLKEYGQYYPYNWWKIGKGINSINGIISDNENRAITGFISLDQYDSVSFLNDSDIEVICVYFSNTNTSTIIGNSGNWRRNANSYLDLKSLAPVGAKYFILMVDITVTNVNDIRFYKFNHGFIDKFIAIENKITNTRLIVVDLDRRGDYTNLVDALNNAGDNQYHHVTILVKEGAYEMPPKVNNNAPYEENNRNLTIIGENQNKCILYNNIGFYDYSIGTDCAPLRLNGNVVIKNLTIVSRSTEFDNYVNTEGYVPRDDYRKASYCIHRDGTNAASTVFKIEDCILINDHMTTIGFGLKPNTELIIESCYCQSEQAAEHSQANDYGTIYGHYSGGGKGLGQNLSIIRSQIVNKTGFRAIAIYDAKSEEATPADTFGTFKFIGNAVNTTNISNALNIASSLNGFYNIDPLSFGNQWE